MKLKVCRVLCPTAINYHGEERRAAAIKLRYYRSLNFILLSLFLSTFPYRLKNSGFRCEEAMGLFETSVPMCHGDPNCSAWAEKYISYCLCSVKDRVSLSLGLISVFSWGVAEVPQILANYRKKSTEGLSIAFLMTWILGDLFNLFGCMLEPSTLLTQYYTAMLYAMTSTVLTAQTLYYENLYHRWKKYDTIDHEASNLNNHQTSGKAKECTSSPNLILDDMERSSQVNTFGREASNPITFSEIRQNSSTEGELYYVSARSLSSSHTPPAGSFLKLRMSPTSNRIQSPMQKPLLEEDPSTKSSPSSSVKSKLCFASAFVLVGTFNLYQTSKSALDSSLRNSNTAVGRKLLKLSSGNDMESSGIGTYLGWVMAAIYMGGRLPQICLNIKRGNVEGLSPLMFIFALVGNATYIGSILASSLNWSRMSPNLPWLVDACGCVVLDTFILIQFIYFSLRNQSLNRKHTQSYVV